MNNIHASFQSGGGFQIGSFCVIEPNVIVGQNVKIGNYVLLKEGTRIGDNCFIDSYARSSGDNIIGNNVTIRFGSTIARRVILRDNVFIAPNVMTEYSRADGSKAIETLIKEDVFIGTAAVIGSGVTIERGIVVGSQSYVSNDLTIENGIYVGVPANLKKRIGDK